MDLGLKRHGGGGLPPFKRRPERRAASLRCPGQPGLGPRDAQGDRGTPPPRLSVAFFGYTTDMDQKTRRKRTSAVFKQHRAFAAQGQAPSPIVKKDRGLTPPCISISILTYPHLLFRTTQSPLVLGSPQRFPKQSTHLVGHVKWVLLLGKAHLFLETNPNSPVAKKCPGVYPPRFSSSFPSHHFRTAHALPPPALFQPKVSLINSWRRCCRFFFDL